MINLFLRQWDQRFWASYDNYDGNGLAFLFIGGESEASPGWLNYGMWYEWAKMHGAAMFVLEHRYNILLYQHFLMDNHFSFYGQVLWKKSSNTRYEQGKHEVP